MRQLVVGDINNTRISYGGTPKTLHYTLGWPHTTYKIPSLIKSLSF